MEVSPAYLTGVVLATLAACSFAIQYICVRFATDDGSVSDVILISLLVNVALIVPATAVIVGVPSVTWEAAGAFVAAGITGSLLARIFMFKGIQTIGASRTAPVVASNVFFATILAIVVFGEELTPVHGVGIVLIVLGVAVISWETAQDSRVDGSLRSLGLSILFPLLAAAFLGFEPIFVSFGLDTGAGILPGFAIKATAATIGFVAYRYVIHGRLLERHRFEEKAKWYLGAGLASTVGIATYFAALEIAPVVIVVPLLQTAPLLVVVLSAMFLPQRLERITVRLIVSAAVVVIGATFVSLSG